MAQMIWMEANGAKIGKFESDIKRKGLDGMMEVHSLSGSVSAPYDGASGHARGHRVHTPINFTKSTDKTSPLWLQAQYTNENLTQVTFHIYRPAQSLGGTAEKEFYTIKLTNARVVSVSFAFAGESRTEQISLVFETITTTYADGGIEANDDWASGFNNAN